MLLDLLRSITDPETSYHVIRHRYLDRVKRTYDVHGNASHARYLAAHIAARGELNIWLDVQGTQDAAEAYDFFLDFLAQQLYRHSVFHTLREVGRPVGHQRHRLTKIVADHYRVMFPVLVLSEFFIDAAGRAGVRLNEPFGDRPLDAIVAFCRQAESDPEHIFKAWRLEAGYDHPPKLPGFPE